jgi:hypothetical protein
MFEESMHAARYHGNKTTFFVALSLIEQLCCYFRSVGFDWVWLICHRNIVNYWLGKQHQFFGEWILLKFNAFAFLSVFLFAFPNHMELKEILKTDN